VVVHTVTSGQRLLDVLSYVETDSRVQMVFTQGPDVFSNGVADLLRSTGGMVLPWQQVIREQFDLALCAAYGGLHELRAPVLVMPHGAGYGKHFVPQSGQRDSAPRPIVYGLDPQRLIRDGRVIVSALVLSHDNQLDILRRQCPEALPVAVVAGDPCYDRLAASLPRRADYRAALGVDDGRQLVVVTSTWGRRSLFGDRFDIVARLVHELPPDQFQVVGLFHPAVWFGHSRRQIMAWLSDYREAGLLVIEPEADWRGVIVAADHVVGDHGSMLVYAASIGRPVLRTDSPLEAVAEGSAQRAITPEVPVLAADRPLPDQFAVAADGARTGDAVARLVTSRPGQADVLLREAMYRLLGLSIPGRHRRAGPVPVPHLRGSGA